MTKFGYKEETMTKEPFVVIVASVNWSYKLSF